jgi:hypothetical protein
MNIKLLYYLISNRFKEYNIKNTENIVNYLSNLDNLIVNKQKELAYLKATKTSNIDLVNLIRDLKTKYNSIKNILTSYKNDILSKINKLNDTKLYLSNNYSQEFKKNLNKYINHNILYYNNLLNANLIWYDFNVNSDEYNIEDILNNCNNYISINNNILCMLNYNSYKSKYIDYILLEYLNINKWDLSVITNHKMSSYINNKINSDLQIDKTIHINYILNKIKLLIKLIKTNIINYKNNNVDEIIIYLSTLFNYILLDFDVEFWRNYIQEIKINIPYLEKKSQTTSTQLTTKDTKEVLGGNKLKDTTTTTTTTTKLTTTKNTEKDTTTKNTEKDTTTKNTEKDKKNKDTEKDKKNKDTEEEEVEESDEEEEEEEIESDSLILPENIVKPEKMTNENAIKFDITNKYAWLSLDWADVDSKVVDKIHINYSDKISDSKVMINDIEFNNLITYLYLKKIKYMREFLDNNKIDITDYIKQIFDEDGEYIKPNDVIRLFDKNFDKYIMTKIEKGKVLEEFNELIRDWNKDKVEVIRKGLYNKYIQNEILKIALLNTGDKYLVDLDDMDDGRNIVGIVSMQIRYILSQQ